MRIQKFVFNIFAENTFLIWDEISKAGIIIDPGCSNPKEEKILKDFIWQNNIVPEYLINTHCHIDHILGNSFVIKNWNLKFLAAKEDVFLLDLFEEQAALFNLIAEKSPYPDIYISEDLLLGKITLKIKLISTPGHSPGGYCIYFPDEKICVTGDTLFNNSIGRTDLWKGNFETIINSIRQKLLILPDDVIIHPGHGKESTIQFEKLNNQFLT
jgi:hydroxyacylglutathione hydrolase